MSTEVPAPPAPSCRQASNASAHGVAAYRLLMAAGGVSLGLLLTIPFAALITSRGPGELASGLATPAATAALRVSLSTTALATVVVILGGTPLSWWLARTAWRPARWLETLLQLPVVIPPAVGGLALLLAFGRHGLVGRWLDAWGWSPAFTVAAVIMAQIFVSAPFFLQAATTAFAGIDRNLLITARSVGASAPVVFFRVALPIVSPALVSGAAMSWARALGEFGATLMFAGSFPGTTQTLPLAIYACVESDMGAAQALSLVLVTVAFAVLLGTRRLWPRRGVVRAP